MNFDLVPKLPEIPSKEDIKAFLQTVNDNLQRLEESVGIPLPRVDAGIIDQVNADLERVMKEVDEIITQALDTLCKEANICLPNELYPATVGKGPNVRAEALNKQFEALEETLWQSAPNFNTESTKA